MSDACPDAKVTNLGILYSGSSMAGI